MNVELIACTNFDLPDGDYYDEPSAISRIARVCTAQDYDWHRLKMCKANQFSLMEKLYEMGHLSVFEHFSMTYFVDGISRACSLQLARHRHTSRTERSQRYVALNFESINAIRILTHEELKQWFVYPPEAGTRETAAIDGAFRRALESYHSAIQNGMKKEDARFVLPEATKTTLFLTVNLRTLIELWRKRGADPAAQWEIRALVGHMKDAFIAAFGTEYEFLFEAADAGR